MSENAAVSGKKEKLFIVVPTYREAENIPVLARRVDEVAGSLRPGYRLVIVDDDSPDDTPAVVAGLKDRYPIDLIVRKNPPRCLSSSVLDGIRSIARGTVVVMDADLQHPPEKIPELVAEVESGRADFVLGSRFVKGAATENFRFLRQLNSLVATWLARPLTRVSDPMSGFFCFRRDIIRDVDALDPVGYKIALEILVKCGIKRVGEVAIVFGERKLGQSKLSLKEQVKYLRHLAKLYRFRWAGR